MKKTVIIIVTLLVVLAVVAGSFWAGMSFGQARANQARERLLRERFGGPGGQAPGLFGTPQPGQGGAERWGGGPARACPSAERAKGALSKLGGWAAPLCSQSRVHWNKCCLSN